METTKKQSPFTHFDLDYYNNLRLLDTSKAEAYRKKMTAPLQTSRNLSHEKYADQMLNKEVAKDILFVKKYAEKNKISQEQAIIDIRQSFIKSINKGKEFRPTEEEVKRILLTDDDDSDNTTDLDKLEGTLDDNTSKDGQKPSETSIPNPEKQNKSDDEEKNTIIDQDKTTANEDTNKVDPYADVTKDQLLEKIKSIDPTSPVNNITNKETLVSTYEELIAIKDEETK